MFKHSTESSVFFPQPQRSRLQRHTELRASVEVLDSARLLTETYGRPLLSLARTATESYGSSLVQNPLPTKSLTAGFLCGISDVIAQKRDPLLDDYNPKRTLRFASKGCIGGILWMYWYDWIDGFLQYQDYISVDNEELSSSLSPSKFSFYSLVGAALPPGIRTSFLAFSKDHIGPMTTALSIVLEQFFWCPLVYGMFEIPVSTVMNNGVSGVRGIPTEVKSNLNRLLVSNAKVWTLANVLIYNTPLEWRLFIGNVVDIFWQSIVSDISANCGVSEECDIDEDKYFGEADLLVATMMAAAAAKEKENDNNIPSGVPEPSLYSKKENDNNIPSGVPEPTLYSKKTRI